MLETHSLDEVHTILPFGINLMQEAPFFDQNPNPCLAIPSWTKNCTDD